MIPPGSTIGIVGGGQLGRMLAMAAAELGYHTHVYCPEKDAPAFEVAGKSTVGAYDDLKVFAQFAASVDVVTIEFENISSEGLAHAARQVPVHPSPGVLQTCQNRIREKAFLTKLGVPVAKYVVAQEHGDFFDAQFSLGLPYIVKTAESGYDGKGQLRIKSSAEVEMDKAKLLWNETFQRVPLVFEAVVDFAMEISVIVARGADGDMVCFPAVQNIHKNHILHQTIAPAPIAPKLAQQAEALAKKIAEGLKLVGVLAVEMFVTKDNKILVNELAPRPHNSGHWTLDACVHSQFELAVRAVCGLKLAAPRVLSPAVMTNLIGDDVKKWAGWLKKPNARLHLYGKKEARPGRKMGHVTEVQT